MRFITDIALEIKKIQSSVETYLKDNNINCLVIGISGGLDSGVNAALLKPVCNKNNIKLIGSYIHVETNSPQEATRAQKIGNVFCDEFEMVDLTSMYHSMLSTLHEERKNISIQDKIRLGNIKARLRMIYLYNLAQKNHGIVVDNDNLTERLLGFWTLNGDVGDIVPLASLFKTDVFKIGQYLADFYSSNKMYAEYEAIINVVKAVPTDGLGITSSDLEQLGASSYQDVDDILYKYLVGLDKDHTIQYLYSKYGNDVVDKILTRHKNSTFKRNHPYRISL